MQAAIFCKASRAGVKITTQTPPSLTHDPHGSQKAITKNVPWCLIKVCGVGLNPVDAKKLYGDKLPPFFLGAVERMVEGWRVGFDFSGTILECDPAASLPPFNIHPGDTVFGTSSAFIGSCAEIIRLPADQMSHCPRSLPLLDCSAIPLAALTCLQAFTNANLKPGSQQHVLVIGASGGTGHLAVQIAKAMGAERITAICGERNRDFVLGLGADTVIDYNQTPEKLLEALRHALVKSTTSPAPSSSSSSSSSSSTTTTPSPSPCFDIVFDTVSSHDERDSVWEYESRIRGANTPTPLFSPTTSQYLFIGGKVGDWFLAHVKRFGGLNLFGKGRELFWVRFPASNLELQRIAQMIDNGQVKVHISERLAFTEENVQLGFEKLLSRRSTGKILLDLTRGMEKGTAADVDASNNRTNIGAGAQ